MGGLGLTLRTLRDDARLTQEELAERSGLSVRTISDIERGLRRRLYADTAGRLATALGLAGRAHEEFSDLARGRLTADVPELDIGYRHRFVSVHLRRIEEAVHSVGVEDRWFAALDADEANVEVALRWAQEAGDSDALLRLATGLWQYWQARGRLAHGRAWLERGLAAAARHDAVRAATLGAAAERLREEFAGRALPLDARLLQRALDGARASVTPDTWSAAWTTGRALRLEASITLALGT